MHGSGSAWGWNSSGRLDSSKTLVSVTAYPSFGGEVEALDTPTIRRLTPSCRHQLSALARLSILRTSRYFDNCTIIERLDLGKSARQFFQGHDERHQRHLRNREGTHTDASFNLSVTRAHGSRYGENASQSVPPLAGRISIFRLRRDRSDEDHGHLVILIKMIG